MSEFPIYTPLDRQIPRAIRYTFELGQVAEGLKNASFNLFVLFPYNWVLPSASTSPYSMTSLKNPFLGLFSPNLGGLLNP